MQSIYQNLPNQLSNNQIEANTILKNRYILKQELGQGSFRQPHIVRTYGFENQEAYNMENFIVMDLKGINLANYKKQQKIQSELHALDILLQALQAIQDMHQEGIIHRDVKPSNFVMGSRPEEQEKVFLVDFGLAKDHIDKYTGRPQEARKNIDFRGTIPYASVNAHLKKDLGRRDDMWGFFYMMLEFLEEPLIWKSRIKYRQVKEIFDSLIRLKYHSQPQYDFISNYQQRQILNQNTGSFLPQNQQCFQFMNQGQQGVQGFNNFFMQDFQNQSQIPQQNLHQNLHDKQPQESVAIQNCNNENIPNKREQKHLEKLMQQLPIRMIQQNSGNFSNQLQNMNYGIIPDQEQKISTQKKLLQNLNIQNNTQQCDQSTNPTTNQLFVNNSQSTFGQKLRDELQSEPQTQEDDDQKNSNQFFLKDQASQHQNAANLISDKDETSVEEQSEKRYQQNKFQHQILNHNCPTNLNDIMAVPNVFDQQQQYFFKNQQQVNNMQQNFQTTSKQQHQQNIFNNYLNNKQPQLLLKSDNAPNRKRGRPKGSKNKSKGYSNQNGTSISTLKAFKNDQN
eukprot:403374077